MIARRSSPARFPAAAWTAAVLVALAAALGGCAEPAPSGPAPTAVRLDPLDPPAVEGALAPRVVAGADGVIRASWIEPLPDDGGGAGHALRISALRDGGWTEPRTAAEGDDWFVNWADTPALAALADGTLAVSWLRKSGAGNYDYHVIVSTSRDDGATWSAPLRVHAHDGPGEHGFVSLIPEGDAFRAVWLDGRRTVEGGSMTLRSARLNAAGEVEAEEEIDPRVCDCCPTDLVRLVGGSDPAAGTGTLAVWRDRSADEVRDIAWSVRGADGWQAPRALHRDGWRIDGCPVNGPAVAAGAAGGAFAVWFTAEGPDGEPAVLAVAGNGGGFGAPLRLDGGRPLGRVDVVALGGDGDRALASWLEIPAEEGERADDGAAALVVRPWSAEGAGPTSVVARVPPGRSSGVPRLAPVDGGAVAIWTDPGPPSRLRAAWIRLEGGGRP